MTSHFSTSKPAPLIQNILISPGFSDSLELGVIQLGLNYCYE